MVMVPSIPWTLWIWSLNHLITKGHYYPWVRLPTYFKQKYYNPRKLGVTIHIMRIFNFPVKAFQLKINLSHHTQITLDNKVYVLGGKGSPGTTVTDNQRIYQ